MFGIYVDNLKDVNGYSKKGSDPFAKVFGYNITYTCYDPSHIYHDGLRA